MKGWRCPACGKQAHGPTADLLGWARTVGQHQGEQKLLQALRDAGLGERTIQRIMRATK